jgi:hypothetical protein
LTWGQAQVTTGSQLNSPVLVELPSLLPSGLSAIKALLPFPPLHPLRVDTRVEKKVVYCIHGSLICRKLASLIVLKPAVSKQVSDGRGEALYIENELEIVIRMLVFKFDL